MILFLFYFSTTPAFYISGGILIFIILIFTLLSQFRFQTVKGDVDLVKLETEIYRPLGYIITWQQSAKNQLIPTLKKLHQETCDQVRIENHKAIGEDEDEVK
jgi:hypothetical protein